MLNGFSYSRFQEYTFILKHCVVVKNKAVDALSRMVIILQAMSAKVVSSRELF